MSTNPGVARFRAGDTVDDRCQVCKDRRSHTVIATDGRGGIIRVICVTCGSQHNYRGGGAVAPTPRASASSHSAARGRDALPAVSERERKFPVTHVAAENGEPVDLEMLIRTVLREESGLTAVTPADRWRGGDLVLRPGTAGLQEKVWPIETFFHKVVMLRNRLRVLEQQVNATEIPDDQKVKLQSYITACYGSLTSFNVLFADDDDRFHGCGGD
ncbi:MAG: hypothetical protein HYV63_22385 [Candidatus Schekmanbacteria bacterium]|nr:hypothetical protein [Candidatus Schekmanbacteria bacterium]